MKEIILIFKTTKGVKAYEQSETEGSTKSKMEMRIVRCLFKDSIINRDPLTIQIKIKSERMAIRIDLPKQIENGLSKFGAKKGVDYELKIK